MEVATRPPIMARTEDASIRPLPSSVGKPWSQNCVPCVPYYF